MISLPNFVAGRAEQREGHSWRDLLRFLVDQKETCPNRRRRAHIGSKEKAPFDKPIRNAYRSGAGRGVNTRGGERHWWAAHEDTQNLNDKKKNKI